MDRATRRELLQLLTPLFGSENERRALLSLALGHNAALLGRIDFSGPSEPFTLNLLTTLVQYGDIEPGQPALWALLETVRERVGIDKQAKIDRLQPVINPAAAAATATEIKFSGRNKIQFCDRLGASWKDLADVLDIPPADQARFDKGDEGRGIWLWLENRGRLGELPEALEVSRRKDLARLLRDH